MGKINLPTGLRFDGKNYVIDKTINGVRIFERLGAINENEATTIFCQKVASLVEGRTTPKTASSLTVNSVLDYYYSAHLKNLKSGVNAKWLIPTISRLIGHRKVLDLKCSDIENYKILREREKNNRKQPISKRTIQAELQFLSMAINRAVDDEFLPENRIKRFCKVEVPRRKKIVLDHGEEFGPEWIRLYKNFPKDWRLFFLTCYETGMRPVEVSKLQKDWIQKVGDSFMIVIPAESEKTGFNDRRIPVSPILAKRLIPAANERSGNIFDHHDYFKAFRGAVKDSKFDKCITAYALRRTRATIWDNIDSSAARVALGHVPLDPHEESYVLITNQRLFKLVGIELSLKLKLLRTA